LHRGRSKDLIIRGAHNIDPLVIESALLEHPAVLHAAAIGEPDRDKGELTAVGKIFKPDLRLDVVRHCVPNVAARIDEGRKLDVEVRETGGSIAVVLAVPDPSMAAIADNVRRELERYTFRVEVESGSF
jgi:acyl-CoA synthetase (AMP-forming)/AMP-acid ligase II